MEEQGNWLKPGDHPVINKPGRDLPELVYVTLGVFSTGAKALALTSARRKEWNGDPVLFGVLLLSKFRKGGVAKCVPKLPVVRIRRLRRCVS